MDSLILSKEQINNILDKTTFKYKQQRTNLKRKMLDGKYDTKLTQILIKEIIYLNNELATKTSQCHHILEQELQGDV